LVESVEALKQTRAIDLRRTCGKGSTTSKKITLEEREGVKQELLKARELEFI
jgi:hypothetical protein